MGMYVKGYKQRKSALLTVMAVIVIALILCYALFQHRLNTAISQLATYDAADYNIIYQLNYKTEIANEYIFPDADIALYLDSQQSKRIPVSFIMAEGNATHSLEYLRQCNDLTQNEISITQNTANQYHLVAGDVVYADFSYSSQLIPLVVKHIIPTDYDYSHLILDSNIGIAVLGYDYQYESSALCKYLVFSEKSLAAELSEFPQVISMVYNKTEMRDSVFSQVLSIFIYEFLFACAAVCISHILFFSKSKSSLVRCYLKGMHRWMICGLSLAERITIGLVPCIVTQCLLCYRMPINDASIIYISIPILLFTIYCLIFLVTYFLIIRKKGI